MRLEALEEVAHALFLGAQVVVSGFGVFGLAGNSFHYLNTVIDQRLDLLGIVGEQPNAGYAEMRSHF